MAKANARHKVTMEEIAKRGDGRKEQPSDVLTEGEKVQVAVMMERLNLLQTQFEQMRRATADLITTIVTARGLDSKLYGVNLAAGRILPVEPLPAPVKPLPAPISEDTKEV